MVETAAESGGAVSHQSVHSYGVVRGRYGVHVIIIIGNKYKYSAFL